MATPKGKTTRIGSGPAPRPFGRDSLSNQSDKSGRSRVTDLTGRTKRKGSTSKGTPFIPS